MSKRILIVDDQVAFIELFKEYFEDFGYEVVTSPLAKKAIEIFEQNPCDLVITDVVMPGMNGLDFLKELKKRQKDLHVIVISGFTTEEQVQEALKLGADVYLEKPFSLQKLKENVERLLTKGDDPDAKDSIAIEAGQIWTRLFSNMNEDAEREATQQLLTGLHERQVKPKDCELIESLLREFSIPATLETNKSDKGKQNQAVEITYGFCQDRFLARVEGLPDDFSLRSDGPWKYAAFLCQRVMDSCLVDSQSHNLLMEKRFV